MKTDMLKKKNENKYLILDSTDEDKEPLKKILKCLEWNQKQNQRNKRW